VTIFVPDAAAVPMDVLAGTIGSRYRIPGQQPIMKTVPGRWRDASQALAQSAPDGYKN